MVLGAAFLLAVNVWPGWWAVPFLTAETEQVLSLVNLSIVLGIVANLANAVFDLAWLRLTGEVVTSAVCRAVADGSPLPLLPLATRPPVQPPPHGQHHEQ